MADEKDHEVHVKVVDRRRWREGGEGNPEAATGTSLKPTYVEELERKLAQREKEAEEYLGKYRQASHEFEDARARMRKELAKDTERNRREVLLSLLEVLDNLDRAIDSSDRSDLLLEGIRRIRDQFLAKLDGFGVKRMAGEGVVFDPALHEAVSTVPAADPSQDGLIVGVVRHGYRIGDEVLRPALVAVAKAGAVIDNS